MPSGDGLLVRVKPFGGRLPRAGLHALADAAAAYGNGVVELTRRGNVQVRGLSEASAPRFAGAMVEAGLADADPVREARRNVIVMPPYDDELAAEVEAVLAGIEGLAAKFCVAIGQADADVVIMPAAPDAPAREHALRVMGVRHGMDPRLCGDDGCVRVPYTTEALRCLAVSAAGRRLPRSGVGAVPSGADLMFLPFGRTDVAGLRRLAGVTDAARTTPFRAFYVPGFAGEPDTMGIAACPGAPACASGCTPTRDDARLLAELGIKDVHVSGCDKGCAYPQPARTLVGRDGRYDLVRLGRAGDRPDVVGLTIAQAAVLLA